jgi:hypothetical protein
MECCVSCAEVISAKENFRGSMVSFSVRTYAYEPSTTENECFVIHIQGKIGSSR